MGSWNKEALLHNKNVAQKDWVLNPIVNEYKGIVATFGKLGYVTDSNFFVFAYDWRKSIDSIVDDLNAYINAKPAGKYKIVGHSLGGLVARIYSQKYGATKIDTILTVGSPHYGAAKSYKPVESGQIDQDNSWQWLGEKMIMQLNREFFDSDRKLASK